MENVNPYQAPRSIVQEIPKDTEAERIRREHIKHEASLKSIGALHYLGGLCCLLFGVVMFKEKTAVSLLLLGLAVLELLLGKGVRQLKPWIRVPVGIFSSIGLLSIPVGTLINGYTLYLVFSKKGRTVLSPEYQDVIAATPQIKYKTSIVVWIFLGLLVLLIGVAILSSILRH